MKKILLLAILLSGCDSPQPVTETKDGQPTQQVAAGGSSFGERMAESAAAGAAAGAAGAATHAATSHALNRWQEKRDIKRSHYHQPPRRVKIRR